MSNEAAGSPGSVGSSVPARGAGRAAILVGIVALVLGLLIGIASVAVLAVRAGSALADQISAPVIDTPGTETVSLDQGHYLVFQLADGSATTLTHDDVQVVPSDGSPALATHRTTVHEEVTRFGDRYVAFAGFDVPASGTYTVTVSGDPSSVLVAKGVASSVAGAVGWAVGVPFGGILVIAGIVLLAVGLTRRRRERRGPAVAYAGYAPGAPYAAAGTYPSGAYPQTQPYAQAAQPYAQPAQPAQPVGPPPVGPPPGWYPDPDPARQGLRYWDGSAWTGHVG